MSVHSTPNVQRRRGKISRRAQGRVGREVQDRQAWACRQLSAASKAACQMPSSPPVRLPPCLPSSLPACLPPARGGLITTGYIELPQRGETELEVSQSLKTIPTESGVERRIAEERDGNEDGSGAGRMVAHVRPAQGEWRQALARLVCSVVAERQRRESAAPGI